MINHLSIHRTKRRMGRKKYGSRKNRMTDKIFFFNFWKRWAPSKKWHISQMYGRAGLSLNPLRLLLFQKGRKNKFALLSTRYTRLDKRILGQDNGKETGKNQKGYVCMGTFCCCCLSGTNRGKKKDNNFFGIKRRSFTYQLGWGWVRKSGNHKWLVIGETTNDGRVVLFKSLIRKHSRFRSIQIEKKNDQVIALATRVRLQTF